MTLKVAPSILSADFVNMGQSVHLAEECGADLLHCDVMDGMFVPNISFGFNMISAIRKITNLTLDVHLMIEQPERYIERFAQAGADIISIHAEATQHIHRALSAIRDCGKKVGLVLNPATPLDFVRYVLDDVDMVLLMTVNPGYGGQKFIPACLDKIASLRAMILEHSDKEIDIEVDGGISSDNAAQIVAAGANVLVVGSSFYESSDPKKEVELIRKTG